MDAMKKRRMANVATAAVVAGASFVAMGATGIAVLAIPGFMALGAMFVQPRLRVGDAVLVMAHGEWAPGWVVAPVDDGAIVQFDGSWGYGQGMFPGKDIELI
jgi:hypothetical protein